MTDMGPNLNLYVRNLYGCKICSCYEHGLKCAAVLILTIIAVGDRDVEMPWILTSIIILCIIWYFIISYFHTTILLAIICKNQPTSCMLIEKPYLSVQNKYQPEIVLHCHVMLVRTADQISTQYKYLF